MTADHQRLLASIQRRALDAGVPRDELDAQVADELRVPLDHYVAYLLVRGALDSYPAAHHPAAHPVADNDVPSDRPEARQLRRLWEHVGAIHEAAVAGGDIPSLQDSLEPTPDIDTQTGTRGAAAAPCGRVHPRDPPPSRDRAMLNIGRMAPGGEGYYLATVADGVEDYYLGRGEAPGRWVGASTPTLGLHGTVTAEQLRTVLAGQHPETGEPLLGQRQRTVPGFDLTFRAPKSVSLLYGLGDDHVTGQVTSAHDAAVDAALGYLERHAFQTRRGRGGTERVPATGAVAAAFRHRASRAGDPLLHTHVLVANLAQAADDHTWRTLDSRRLYTHAKTAGYLYQTHLREQLSRRLGVGWDPVVNGTADVTGIPRAVIEAFSRRRRQILDAMAARGQSSARAAQIATLDTRHAKHHVDPAGLRQRWRERAAELGFGPDKVARLLHRRPPARTPLDEHVVAQRLLGPDGLTERASTFSRRDVLQAWCEQLPRGAPIDAVEGLADRLLSSDDGAVVDLDRPDSRVVALTSRDAIRLADGRVVAAAAHEHRYTTPGLLALEQRLLDQGVARRDAGVAVVPDQIVDTVLAARPSTTGEQAAMVRTLTTSGAGVDVVVGRAGAGKTWALDAARAAWHTAGRRVIGTALAARAALELEAGAGIPSSTLDRLLIDLDDPRRGGLAAGSVVVVDEAGMVGTRTLARLLDHARAADAKVVLVGDPHQLPEIDAGGLLRGLATRLPIVELADNRRQTYAWERDALAHLRHGTPTDAVDAYRRHGRITVADTTDGAREALVGDWWHARTEHDLDGLMIAARRADVANLNHRARLRMAAAGELAGSTVTAAGRDSRPATRSSACATTAGSGWSTAPAAPSRTSTRTCAPSRSTATTAPARSCSRPATSTPASSTTATPSPPTKPKA